MTGWLARSGRIAALVVALLINAGAKADTDRPRIAIIIDDLGYQWDAGLRVIALPGPVACAILPQTPRAAELARLANEARGVCGRIAQATGPGRAMTRSPASH